MPTIHKPSRRSLIVQRRKNSRLLVMICLASCVATVGYVSNLAKSAVTPSVAKPTTIESFNVGMKMGRYKIQLGRDTVTTYRAGLFSTKAGNDKVDATGSSQLSALQSGQVQPLSMANEDFDGDGMQDLVIGYAGGAGGVLTLRRGNLEAISPQSPEVQAGLREGRYPSPFVNDVAAYAVPENPDFLATGDFDADGYSDVVAAARNGQKLYFFAGDSKGGFKAMQEVSLPGMITTITQGHFNEDGGLTSLAVGVITPDGPRVLVYDQGGKGVNGGADSFALPAPANALMLGNVDGDTAGDLIVGASNHVVMIHGRNPAERTANQNRVEQFDVPYDIAAVSAGDFLFDREGKMKLALLSGDGTIHFLAPGALDTRPFTREEIMRMQKQKQTIRRGEADEASFQDLLKSMVQRSGKGDGWTEQESRSTGATSLGANPQALLTKTATAGALLDQLLVLEPANNKIELIDHDSSINPASLRQPDGTASVDTFDTEAAPIAVATMRLSMSGRLGTVILQSNQTDPGLVVPMANTWNVNSNVDAVDDSPGNSVCHTSGGVCTLRAAMMESSYRGGDNIINLQTATYTLTLNGVSGGADNEFGGAGDDQTGGDLDIVDLPDICAFLGGCPGLSLGSSLTSVTINGNGIANTIIQMGTLANVCNSTKDRILDVNPGADPQFPTNVIINSLTMQNGNAPNWNTTLPGCGGGGGFFHEDGGGIQFDGTKSQNPNAGPTAILTLTTVKINANTSAGQGGGVFVNSGSGLIQTNSLITSNTTNFGSGGGISYNGGNINLSQTLTISGTTIGGASAGNTAPDTTFGNGGGLNTNGGTGITINSSSAISNNVAGNLGGGISFANSPVIAISSSTISNNTAKTNGGGIYCSARNAITNAGSTATLTTTSVTGNTADSDANGTGDGGGIYNLMGTLTVQTTSHIDGNTAVNGGGIFDTWTANTNDTPASVVVNTSSTIGQTGSGNNAKNNGGGIGIDLGGNSATTPKVGTVTITGITLQANTANSDNTGGGDGGGLYENGNNTNFEINVTLDSSTIDNNVANSANGDGIKMDSGMITLANAGTNALSNGDSFSMAGGTLNTGNGTFNITGNYIQSGGTFSDGTGTMNLSGNFTFSGGTFTANSGTIAFIGSSAQSASGAVSFFNLTINNGSGVTLLNSDTVNGTLTLTNGALSIGTTTLTLNGAVSFVAGSGSISSGNTGTVNYNQGSGGQNIAPGTYGNLTFSNFAKTLPNGQTVSISNVFTPGSGVPTITGSTVDFNGTGAQNIPVFNFNNLTISGNRGGGTVTLASGTIGVAGTFNPSATNVNYTKTGNTFDFNGTGTQSVAAFNYNNLTISGARGGATVTLPSGTVGVAGTFNPSATSVVYSISGNTFDFNGTGTQSVAAFNYNNLTISGARGGATVTLPSGTVGVAGTFNPSATSVVYSKAGNTFDFNGAGTQSVAAFNYQSLTISGARGGATVTLGSGTIGVAGTFNPSATSVVYSTTGNTVDFNGTGTQSVAAFNYNNLTISGARGGATVTLPSGTVGVAGTFNPSATSVVYSKTGNTFDFNGAGTQSVAAFNYNNLTISGDRSNNAVTLASGTIGVAGTFNPSATNVSSYVLTGNTFEYNGLSAQAMPSGFLTYNNLTLNNVAGVTGVSGLTVNGLLEVKAGTFTSATTYNNVQIDSGATLAATADITVTGNWTDNGTFTANTNTVNFNGTAAQTIGLSSSSTTPFYNLTISNSSATVSLGHNVTVANNLTVNSGATFDLSTFTADHIMPAGGQTSIVSGATLKIGGTNGFPANYTSHLFGATSTVEYESNSAQTISALAEAYGNLTSSGSGARTLPSGQTVKVFNTFTPGTNVYTITGSAMDFDGNGAQSIPAFSFNDLTISNGRGGATFTFPAGTVKIAGTFTASATSVVYDTTTNSNTVEYNGTSAQLLPSGFPTYFNLTINNSSVAGATGFSGLTVNGLLEIKTGSKFTSATSYVNVQIDSGGTLAATANIDVTGNWTNNGGTFTGNSNTVNFIGSSGTQTIGGTGTTTFDGLTINNTGSGVTLGHDETVNGTLTLTNDLNTTSTFTLTQPSTGSSAGGADVVGNVKRTGFSTSGANTLSFGNPLNTIQINSDSVPADTIAITVNLVKSAPTGFSGAVQRTYTITPTGITGTISATLQLRYLVTELGTNTEAALRFWRFNGTKWQEQDVPGTNTTPDAVNHKLTLTGVTAFSPWTMANVSPTAANGGVSGRIALPDGDPVEGAAVRLSGTQNRLTVTDAQGNYRFDNVETNGFYTVTPSRANFSFSPSQRSFSQLGLHTDAAFAATASSTTLNPLDTTEYFVRQQYVDFFNREPDEAGLIFWVNNIESCGGDDNCRAAKRTDTSAAFFLSIEFQQTGYLVYRTYQAAYGEISNAPVPLKLNEFKPDTQEIGNGLVVNQSGWETVLENNKRAYVNEFVQRARFTAAYPTSLTPAEFVDKLFANAGLTPTASDRNAVINEFGSTTMTSDTAARARALRRVAENATLAQKEFNSAFVLMQYFGYLRRDPNTGPDTNFDGYNFWLTKLNTFNGNFRDAEMVKAFLVSGEYRQRFPR